MKRYYEIDEVHVNGYVETKPLLFRSKTEAERRAAELGPRCVVRTAAWEKSWDKEKQSIER